MAADPHEISALMERLRGGNQDAAGQLVTLFYPELRNLARAHMRRERTGHTWQPTVLVNQLYLELLKIRALSKEGREGQDDRKAFFGLAARLMRRMLIRHARPLSKQADFTTLDDNLPGGDGAADLAVVESLLQGLERIDPQFRAVAELKVFEGMSMEEVADQLAIPVRTAYRRWAFIREWLTAQVRAGARDALASTRGKGIARTDAGP